MRFAYLDEAGVSNRKHEPYALIAGVVVHMDSEYRTIEDRVRELVDKYAPKHPYMMGANFSFHAKDIWHGTGHFPRDDFSREERLSILRELALIVSDHCLPVIYGHVNREQARTYLEESYFGAKIEKPNAKKLRINEITIAYFRCFKRIEAFMRSFASNELCSIVFENNDENKSLINDLQQLLVMKVDRDGFFQPDDFFQSYHVVEPPMFSNKMQSPIIQLADIVAFCLKRKLQNCRYISPIYEMLSSNISHHTVSGGKVAMTRVPSALMHLDEIETR